EGEDGRIKSAVGIGALMEDGIGDTIRVSLTEEPECEIPVAKALIDRYSRLVETLKELRTTGQAPGDTQVTRQEAVCNPFEYHKRKTHEVHNIGGKNVPVVIADFSRQENITYSYLSSAGYNYSSTPGKWTLSDTACDYLYMGNKKVDLEIPQTLGVICDPEIWEAVENKENAYPLFHAKEYLNADNKSRSINFVRVDIETLTRNFIDEIKDDKTIVLVFETTKRQVETPDVTDVCKIAEQRSMFFKLITGDCTVPVIIKRDYENFSQEELLLYAATDLGGLLLDGFGDGIWINFKNPQGFKNLAGLNNIAFGILQATRTRITKTDYISCPSCGRTLFDLQETTAKIRSRTGHLKGIKIGIMGCIVNGPGEMADADYGYVGTGPGKITLYKGKEVIKRNVPAKQAVEALIELIKENGDWVYQDG
ncbi:MAG: flavodoxin-dependent (E)-4-hydroxy-3-methylbut-2-enyl-diphosphate synthase, partial [Bacteroidota bacterium]